MVNSKDINEINSLIVAQLTAEKNKTAIPIAKIDRDYREETGERIPYAKLGFQKLVDYLKTVPGVEVIEMYNAHYVNFSGTEDSQHIVDLVSKQRQRYPPRNPRRFTGYFKTPSNSYGPRLQEFFTKANKNVTDNILSILTRYSNGLTRTELLQKLNYEYALDENLTTLHHHLKILGKQIIIKDKLIYGNTRKKSDDSNSSGYYHGNRVEQSPNNKFDANNHEQAYNNYMTNSTSVSEDLDYNESIDFESNRIYATENDLLNEIKVSDCNNHYNSVANEYVKNYPGMTHLYQENAAHESSVYPENSENSTNDTNIREYIFSQNKDYVSTALSKRVKFRLEKLIESRPQGIWCNELPKLYEEEYKIPLEWANLGFHRLSDFTAHLSDIFHVVGPQLNGDFKLYNAKEPLPDDKPNNKTSKKLTTASLFDIYGDVDIDPVPTSVPASFSKQLCPDDVITIQETVGQVLVTDLKTSNNADKNENPMVEVVVVEAYSPSFFWIRLLKNSNKFNKMMQSLGEYYAENYEKYAVPIIMLEQGLNIACVFYGKWHRAIIKSVDPDCKVTVLFYDYGTVDKYPANEIFYLHRSFTTLPAQAVPCGLYRIGPHEGDRWPKRVRDWFIQWVCEKPLWANILEVDAEKNSMLVTLADTSGKDDFFVNDWLIDKKLAKVKRTECVDPEDMKLYVGDFCEYYTEENGVVETINPTTRRPESKGGMNLSISKTPQSVSSLTNKLELYKYDWKAYKSQVRKKVDELVMLTMELYHEFMKKKMASAAHGVRNFVVEALTESMVKITLSTMDLDPQVVFAEVANTSTASNESISQQDSDSNSVESKQVTINSESIEANNSVLIDEAPSNISDMNNSSNEELSMASTSNPISVPEKIETTRSKLENSIKKAANKFFEDRSISDLKNSTDEKSNPFMESLHNTNPFKTNGCINGISKKSKSEPPPLPPRPINMRAISDRLGNLSKNHLQNSTKIVYEAPPVMYASSEDSSRLDHSNKETEDVCQSKKDSQKIELKNSQTSTQTFVGNSHKVQNGDYLQSITSANPFKSSQRQ